MIHPCSGLRKKLKNYEGRRSLVSRPPPFLTPPPPNFYTDKIGREDAERDYHKKLIPAIHSRQDLFSPNLIPTYYSLERYHIHGSQILSRSFQVERWEGEDEGEANTSIQSVGNTSGDMEVDEPSHPESEDNEIVEEDSDDEDPSDVAMVPMADMLNAKYGCENVGLLFSSLGNEVTLGVKGETVL